MTMLHGSARETVASVSAKLDALIAQLQAQQPVQARAEQPKAFFTKAEIAAGGGFPCALGCGKRLRTAKRAQTHGEDGHFAA